MRQVFSALISAQGPACELEALKEDILACWSDMSSGKMISGFDFVQKQPGLPSVCDSGSARGPSLYFQFRGGGPKPGAFLWELAERHPALTVSGAFASSEQGEWLALVMSFSPDSAFSRRYPPSANELFRAASSDAMAQSLIRIAHDEHDHSRVSRANFERHRHLTESA